MYFKQNVYFALENHENPIGMDVYTLDFPGSSPGKESTWNAGDLGSVPGLGRSPGGEHGNPLWYLCLGNPMDRGVWWATVHGVTEDLDKT